jgi:hypothetical protein
MTGRIKRGTRTLLGFALLAAACSGPPPTVERVTIANPTGYDLDVEVTDRDRTAGSR